jgi:oxygen-independent coproporphyrinogen-3 oxidase
LPAYEISNHARAGAECHHNMIYWRGGDYAAVGPGAHGRLSFGATRVATEAPRSPALWLDSVERRGTGELPRVRLDRAEKADELLLSSLRLAEGLSLRRFAALGGQFPSSELAELEAEGFVAREGDRLSVTPAGRPLLNAILRRLAC